MLHEMVRHGVDRIDLVFAVEVRVVPFITMVIEFSSPEIERLQTEIARRRGFKLIGHRLELYATPIPQAKASGRNG